MKSKSLVAVSVLAAVAVYLVGIAMDVGSAQPEREVINKRMIVFDTAFLQGRTGTPHLHDITSHNVKEEIILRGVFSMPPKHHVDILSLIRTSQYETVSVSPDRIKMFDNNIYSDIVFRLKDDSMCRVQHSYQESDGVTIRVVRDNTIVYIRPNQPDQAAASSRA